MLNLQEIKRRRELLDLTQDQAAKTAGIGVCQKWNDIERGRNANISLRTLIGMAKALNCSISDIVNQSKPKRRKNVKATNAPTDAHDATASTGTPAKGVVT